MKISGSKWEAVCDRCGRCCYEKYDYQGKIFYTGTPCEFLDLKDKCCRVYHNRHKVQPECAGLTPDLVRSGVLPADCPYVRMITEFDKE